MPLKGYKMKLNLFSEHKILIQKEEKTKALLVVMENDLKCIETEINSDRNLVLTVRSKDKCAYEILFQKHGINAEFAEIKGVFSSLQGMRKRYGIIFGFIFLLSVMMYSSRVVWKIEINGSDGLGDQEIINQLETAGFSLGTYIPGIDYDELHNKILLNSENISWISINIVGNVATVEVKKKIDCEEKNTPLYTNVVAKYDGYIESIVVQQGKKVVKNGDVVKKGEILISGVINSQAEGVRYEQAMGQVKAYVNKTILIEIPFIYTKKEYTGNKYTETCYKIYNFPINFLSKYGNQTLLYDTIEKKEKLCFLGISSIPIEITTVAYYEYVLKEVRLSVSEAVDLAFAELRRELDAQLNGAELIDKEVKTYYDSEAFYIECMLYCLEDIAMEQEFFVTK